MLCTLGTGESSGKRNTWLLVLCWERLSRRGDVYRVTCADFPMRTLLGGPPARDCRRVDRIHREISRELIGPIFLSLGKFLRPGFLFLAEKAVSR